MNSIFDLKETMQNHTENLKKSDYTAQVLDGGQDTQNYAPTYTTSRMQSKRALAWCLTLLISIMAALSLSGCSGSGDKPAPSTTAQPAPKVSMFDKKEPIQLGFVPLIDSEKLVDSVKPLEEKLSQQLNHPVKAFVATNYVGVVNALSSGQIDMAYIPPLAYVFAHEDGGARPVLTALSKTGEPYYTSEILVRKDSGITTLDQLKGKRIGFVDPSSTSGYLFPATLLKKAGIDLDGGDGTTVQFTGGHDKSLQLLLNGDVDAIGTFANAPTRYKKDFPTAQDELTVLATSEKIPNITLVVSEATVTAEDEAKIKAAFEAIQQSEDGAALLSQLFNIYGFESAHDEMFNTVRDTAQLMDINLEAIK